MSENLPAVPSTTEQQIVALTAKLRPAEDHAIARIITGLLDFGFVVPSSIPAKKFNDKYRFALQGISETALGIAAGKLVRGEYADHSTNFLPIPAEFAKLAKREERPIREDRMRLRERIDGIAAASLARQTPKDPETVERIRALAAAAVQSLKGVRDQPVEPMTEARADELRRMLALRDHADLTTEQAAARRRAQADLDRYEQDHPEPVAKKHGVECAMLCDEPTFRVFMHECHGAGEPLDADSVAAVVRTKLGIESRSELNRPGDAVARWLDLRAEYHAWMQG